MDKFLEWVTEYSPPILVLLAIGAALIYVLRIVTQLRLERRSEFEQQVLLDRYKLVGEFAHRLTRITTDLNRARTGRSVEGLFKDGEIVPLSAVFDELEAKRFNLSDQFYILFSKQANVVLSLANVRDEDEYQKLVEQYMTNLKELNRLANAEFKTDKVSW